MTPIELPRIPAFDQAAASAARAYQLTLTKPAGSLGRLEELAIWFAGARGRFPVAVPDRAELFVFAADHGVVAEGISAYPAAVTTAMVANFRAGGAAINVLGRQFGLAITVVDVGVGEGVGVSGTGDRATAVGTAAAQFVSAWIRPGTRNFRLERAMTNDEAAAAIAVGLNMASQASERGAEILVGGDMGIGNTTSAAALVCAIAGDEPGEIVGRGTGIDDDALARKANVIREAIARHAPASGDGFDCLSAVGGLEIAALAGLMIGGAARRIPVVVDGFIAGAAALVATRIAPGVRDHLLLSHLSAERGAKRLCGLLGGPAPLLDLGLRLGEGTGAALVVPLVRAAVAAQSQMATFSGASVPERL